MDILTPVPNFFKQKNYIGQLCNNKKLLNGKHKERFKLFIFLAHTTSGAIIVDISRVIQIRSYL